ncbi:hypothetical protein JVT61DRAFT_3987 [Boletus reticuloceps]|uniref:Uncharacterized protein n=1 Tax=Boletus reticuloceps TaxID=495285 RepID=A0A8I2YMK3_9AGAM|nr:hypothetical protein JVT61DRAFT_3987 [Boletus reticuloceps]
MLITNSLVLAFYASNSPASLSILDVAAQLAASTPFLIVVQVGLTNRYRIPRTSNGHDESLVVLTTQEGMTFRAGLRAGPRTRRSVGIAYSPSL